MASPSPRVSPRGSWCTMLGNFYAKDILNWHFPGEVGNPGFTSSDERIPFPVDFLASGIRLRSWSGVQCLKTAARMISTGRIRTKSGLVTSLPNKSSALLESPGVPKEINHPRQFLNVPIGTICTHFGCCAAFISKGVHLSASNGGTA